MHIGITQHWDTQDWEIWHDSTRTQHQIDWKLESSTVHWSTVCFFARRHDTSKWSTYAEPLKLVSVLESFSTYWVKTELKTDFKNSTVTEKHGFTKKYWFCLKKKQAENSNIQCCFIPVSAYQESKIRFHAISITTNEESSGIKTWTPAHTIILLWSNCLLVLTGYDNNFGRNYSLISVTSLQRFQKTFYQIPHTKLSLENFLQCPEKMQRLWEPN